MKTIQQQAMLVNLGIAYWTANASDESVVERISRSTKSEQDQHAYRKILVKPDAINEVKAVRSRARAYHFSKTMPWIDGGTRILPAHFYKEYQEKMKEFRNEYEAAAAKFCRAYSALKGEARKRLGDLFKDDDYPSESSLRSKFSWDIKFLPIPSGNDWRVAGLNSKDEAEMKKQVEEQVVAAMVAASRDLMKRLMEVVSDLAGAMKDSKSTFRNSIVGNIKEMVALVRSMNIMGDEKLEAVCKEVEKTLVKLNADELREDKKKRKEAADDADAILKKMAGYLGS